MHNGMASFKFKLTKIAAALEMLCIKIPFHLCTQLFFTELCITT